MKTTIKTVFCAVASMLAAVSCQESFDPVNPVDEGKGTIDIRVNGLMGEYTQADATRASLVNTIRVSWDGGETVYVYDGTRCLGSLVASLEGDEDRYALLSTDETHTVATPTEGTTKLTLVYSPLLTEAPAISKGVVSISLSDQSSPKVPFVAYATLDYNNEIAITNVVVPFKFATSVIKINCTELKANTAIERARLSNVNTACKISISGTSAPTISGSVNGAIIRTGDSYFEAGKINEEGEAVFQIAVPALESTTKMRFLTVTQNSEYSKDRNFTKKSLNPATSVNTVSQMVALPKGSIPGEFTVDDRGKKVHFARGNMFWDGDSFELEGNQYDYNAYWNPSHVGHFYWSKKAEVAYAESYSDTDIDAYNDKFFTNKEENTANPSFTVNGVTGLYRTLSVDEWTYLLNTRTVNGGTKKDKSYSLNITYCGTMGIVIYPDDYSGRAISGSITELPEGVVFLPAAGSRNRFIFNQPGSYGYYWASSSFDDSVYNAAYYLEFYNKSLLPYYSDSRDHGFSVRLISDLK